MTRCTWPGVLAMAIVVAVAVVSGCSPRVRGDAAAMSEDAIRDAAAEAGEKQAAVRITLRSGESARGTIVGTDEHGLLLVGATVDGGRPRERTVAWSDVCRLDVERTVGHAAGFLVLGILVSILVAFAAVGRGISGF